MAVAQSFGGVAIRYALPVLWMTLLFTSWGQRARTKHDVMFRRSSPGGGTSWTSDNYSVWWSSSECGTNRGRSLQSTCG